MKAFDKNGILLSDNKKSFFTYEAGVLSIDGSTIPLVVLINKGDRVELAELNFKKTYKILLPEKTWLFCDSEFNIYESRIQPLGTRSTPPIDAVNGSFYFDSTSMRGRRLVHGVWKFEDSIPIAVVSGEYIQTTNLISYVPGFGNVTVGCNLFSFQKIEQFDTSALLDQQNIPTDASVVYGIANEPIAKGQPVSFDQFRFSLAIRNAADGISIFDSPQNTACICISEGIVPNLFDSGTNFRAFLSGGGFVSKIPTNPSIYQELGHIIAGDFHVTLKSPEYLSVRAPLPPSSTPMQASITPSPTPSSTIPPTPSNSVTPTPTVTASTTPAVTQTATPSPTASPTPTPAPSQSSTPLPSQAPLGCNILDSLQRLTGSDAARTTEDGQCRWID